MHRVVTVSMALAVVICSLACLGKKPEFAEVCTEVVECLEGHDPASAASMESTYGPDSSCWDDAEAAEICENACVTALDACQDLGEDTDTDIPEDCGNDVDDDDDGLTDCDDPDCEDAAGCEVPVDPPGSFYPVAFLTKGGFGYDAASKTVVTATDGGRQIQPWLTVYLLNDDYLATESPDDFCFITMQRFDAPVALELFTFSYDIGNYKQRGVRFDGAEIETDCTEEAGKPLAPSFGTVEDVIGFGLGLGVGDEHPMVTDFLDDAAAPSERNLFAGGGVENVQGRYLALNYALAFEVDASMRLVTTGGGYVHMETSVWLGTDSKILKSGYYQTEFWDTEDVYTLFAHE